MRNFLSGLCRAATAVLFAAMLVWLFFLAGFSTAVHAPDGNTYLVADNIWLNLLYVLGFAALCWIHQSK